MKKSFWGYNVQEVDENTEYLELQNSRLEKQVKQLSKELESIRAELDQASVFKEDPAKEQEYQKTKEQLAAMQAENDRLKWEINQLSSQVNAAEGRKDEFAQVSSICRAAYEDMSNAKSNTKEILGAFMETFWDNWEAYQYRLTEASKEIAKVQESSKEAFLTVADEILGRYAVLEEESGGLQAQMQEMETIKSDIQSQLSKMLEVLNAENAGDGLNQLDQSQELENFAQDQFDEQHAVLRALNKRSQKTHVSADAQQVAPASSEKPQIVSGEADKKNPLSVSEHDHTDRSVGIGISFGVNTKNIVNE